MKRLKKSEWIANEYLFACKKHLNEFWELHSHDFFEMEYVLSGEGTYTIDGTAYPIAPGSFFFMTPMNMHCVDVKNAELYNIMFSGDICDSVFLSHLASKAPIILTADETLHKYFCVLFDELSRSCDDLTYSCALLHAVIARLYHDTPNEKQPEPLSPISQAELYILNNFKNPLSLKNVADRVCLSPTYFSRLFTAKTGENFKTYITRMRFEYAKKLLAHSDMTVMQICSECGFNDYPNFIRRFKQHTGTYPMEYRQKFRSLSYH